MDLEQRVAELELRLAALEEREAFSPAGRPGEDPGQESFWALKGLKEQLAGLGADTGGVLFTGDVALPTGERYEWQFGLLADVLLDRDWTASADALAALGHPVRLRLLREILGGRRTAAELAELDGLGTSGQIYHHLRQLSSAGWLHTTGRGRYAVPPARTVPLLVALTAAQP
ncbi:MULTISPECIES: ArsR/SmtB family transcription factor [Streptomyces]|uniref:ArsR family transcriptional regulator n=1 Tax=Streptomyces tsukubensis (strain DSM 42081 / NBRC 108919 / NRRL 18488 / 9993) TaxID=1114943 RepID=A0A7G3UEY9_STRT9|nr:MULTISPECIES: helix-turn-helix domain-containing protein [Streptomyces]AZK95046.1 transcriptional regulator [Streptomyces tsukubensis]MYS63183.1 helix-turn-helix domain-containing protein [Streptomyces sp. SID5473]QKM68886.1 ArsR family transcriptional regulator [Streptomyces tsukubensis NRRL18488]TAI43690.1 ArsR family transcriptional regulator [Streptomyces tsukubensis]